jgi:hypothetical protein
MSRQAAINAMCRECIYDERAHMGSWRQQTGACASTTCPLWPYRPVPKPSKGPTGGVVPEGLRKWKEQQEGVTSE